MLQPHTDFTSEKVRFLGQAGGQERSKLTSLRTHEWAGPSYSSQRTCQSLSLISHVLISLDPRDPDSNVPYPGTPPEPDKGLFTWQSTAKDKRSGKKGRPFQSKNEEQILLPRGGGCGHTVLIYLNSKIKRGFWNPWCLIIANNFHLQDL